MQPYIMLLYSTTLHTGVRNLPKVLTWQRPGRESNLVSAIHNSDALPVSHRATTLAQDDNGAAQIGGGSVTGGAGASD